MIKRVYVLISRRGQTVISERDIKHIAPANGSRIEARWALVNDAKDRVDPIWSQFVPGHIIDTVKVLYGSGELEQAIKMVNTVYGIGLTWARQFCNQVIES